MLSPEPNFDSDILELVNNAREVMGLPLLRKLLRGIPDTARKCVLGRSLGLDILLDDENRAYALVLEYRVAYRLARVWQAVRPYGMWNGWAVLLPPRLNEFVRDFDSRCYPSLESTPREPDTGIQSELRRLRFDWIDQHARVADLLERAKGACERATVVQNAVRASTRD
jgi:hypothetical protein